MTPFIMLTMIKHIYVGWLKLLFYLWLEWICFPSFTLRFILVRFMWQVTVHCLAALFRFANVRINLPVVNCVRIQKGHSIFNPYPPNLIASICVKRRRAPPLTNAMNTYIHTYIWVPRRFSCFACLFLRRLLPPCCGFELSTRPG